MLLDLTNRGEIVLDPFSGPLSTQIAADEPLALLPRRSIFRASGDFRRLIQRCSDWIAVLANSVMALTFPPRL
jgi:hypothetical protein